MLVETRVFFLGLIASNQNWGTDTQNDNQCHSVTEMLNECCLQILTKLPATNSYIYNKKFIRVIALISMNIVPSSDIEGRELASVRRYPNEGQYSPISVR